jgi:hypothetical protein
MMVDFVASGSGDLMILSAIAEDEALARSALRHAIFMARPARSTPITAVITNGGSKKVFTEGRRGKRPVKR